MTSAAPSYRFGAFRLDPAARELRRGDALVNLQRLTFDGLVFLVENRGRAVSRDELIGAIWGTPEVEDFQVTQLIMRLRRAIGDDSRKPRFIRTLAGYGYRWVADTRVSTIRDDESVDPVQAPAEPNQLVRRHGEAIAVLPLEIAGGDDAAIGWVRLGAMDLVAGRLRDAGLPVSPSDGVVAALHATADRSPGERSAALRLMLGADVLIEGQAIQTAGAWKVAMTATTASNDRRRVESDPTDIIPAAARAADLMLAALGEPVRVCGDYNESLSELLQRARAAALALELDTARAILTDAPRALRETPEVGIQLAWIEHWAGHYARAREIASELIAQPALASRLRLHAEALVVRGLATAFKHEIWLYGLPDFDAAVERLADDPWAPQLGKALRMRGCARAYQNDFKGAAQDLGRARIHNEINDDRLGVALDNSYMARLELQRKRTSDALPYIHAAIVTNQAFGHVNALRANLFSLLETQTLLLRRTEALATSERLMALHERVAAPLRRNDILITRADALIALGRHREAADLLATFETAATPPPRHTIRGVQQSWARLAWQRGDDSRALRAATRALALWDELRGAVVRPPTELLLLCQRASIRAGRPRASDIRGMDAERAAATGSERDRQVIAAADGTAIADDPVCFVIRAEWAAYQGAHEQADVWFHQALDLAERWAVPQPLALVADAYGRWLLERGRLVDAIALAGRVGAWADQDFDCALLQLAVLHAGGRRDAWAAALRQAEAVAGERGVPTALVRPPE